MARAFQIEIYNKADWFIESKDGVDGDIFETQAVFAHHDQKNGKIVYLHDYMMHKDTIDMAKKEGGAYLEKCSFTYEGKTFEGTFIDALEFVNGKVSK